MYHSLSSGHVKEVTELPMSLGQTKIVRTPANFISEIKVHGTLAMSKKWQILADDLPAPVRCPGTSADFFQNNSSAGRLFGNRCKCDCNILWKWYRQFSDIGENRRRPGVQNVGRFLLPGRRPAQMWLRHKGGLTRFRNIIRIHLLNEWIIMTKYITTIEIRITFS